MINLLSNAVKYSSKEKNLLLKYRPKKKEGEIIYSISDNGVVLICDIAGKLFGVFQRLHAPTRSLTEQGGPRNRSRIIHRHKGEVGQKVK